MANNIFFTETGGSKCSEGVDCQLQEFWESRDGRFQESKAKNCFFLIVAIFSLLSPTWAVLRRS